MKLEHKGHSIMVLAFVFLLAGCKPKSGLEQLNANMAGLKALKSQYVVQIKGQKDVTVNFMYSKPTNLLVTSDDFVLACNELDGHFETVHSAKTYDLTPWDKKTYPGTTKLVDPEVVAGGPVTSMPPSAIEGKIPWKLDGKSGTVEQYTKVVQTMKGPQTYKLDVDSATGKPVKFISPTGAVFVTKSFEISDTIPIEKFRVEPKDGYVCHRIYPDSISLQVGQVFDFSKFKSTRDTNSFKLEGNTLFAIVDPSESSSANSASWLKQPNPKYKKVSVSIGKADSGFYDPTGDEIRKLTSTTPTFVLVGKDGHIIGMWLGFDPEGTAPFEADILKAIG